ncbi:MAG: DUF2240 family protein [Candidatus Hermodarchaeota archaeon]|nr:DUF2240 family protein [Candidatus Hermodarchaeota archaeon]
MFSVPRNPVGLVDYALRALGKDHVPIQQLVFFLSFDIRQMAPSQALKLIKRLQSEGQISIENGLVKVSHEMVVDTEIPTQTASTNLGEHLRLFVSSSRLSRAVGMNNQAIEFIRVSQNPLKVEATVHGSQDYILILDEASRRIAHNCPDWRKVSLLHRFCKHVAKLFLILEKEESIRLLQSLQVESWEFEQL